MSKSGAVIVMVSSVYFIVLVQDTPAGHKNKPPRHQFPSRQRFPSTIHRRPNMISWRRDPCIIEREKLVKRRANMITLRGKIVLVTGAARGIGAAITSLLAQSAEALALTDLDEFAHDFPCPTKIISADLSDPDAPARVIAETLSQFGRIDGLVNAAGLTTRGSFLDPDPVLFDRLFAVNTRAPYLLMAGAIADMRARKAAGSIVNIQSMNAHCGAPDLAVYSATKGALQTLTKNAANAHMADRIRVNGINLGWVDTETERHLHDITFDKGKGWLAAQGAKLPLGRFVSADDAARLATYLLSDTSIPMTGTAVDLEQTVVGAP
jgi:NAD(P)-dependent dehydrogenase (short-subunit alcohol dehydrogenase family)